MSHKYILRSGAIDAIKRNSGTLYTREAEFLLQKVISLLKNAPAADVAKVVHARWERINSNWRCTRCNRGYRITFGAPMASSFAYCPNCGAMMDGGCENA